MPPLKSLSDILRHGAREKLAQAWDSTEAAKDFAPLPSGEYVADTVSGEFVESKVKGTPGYKITFEVCEGEFVGRRFWHDVWLTEAAMPMAKRDLGKLGIESLDQLDRPLPRGIRCRVKLGLRRNNDGSKFNRVIRFEVTHIVEPEPDAFGPSDEGDGYAGGEPQNGDVSFDPAELEGKADEKGGKQ